MKKLIITTLAAAALTFAACSSIGNNPEQDGRDMMNQCIALLKDGKVEEAQKTVEKYAKVYKEKSFDDKATFIKAGSSALWDNMLEGGAAEWAKITEQLKPALEKFRELQEDFDTNSAENEE